MLFTQPDQVKPIAVFHLSNPEFLKMQFIAHSTAENKETGNWSKDKEPICIRLPNNIRDLVYKRKNKKQV